MVFEKIILLFHGRDNRIFCSSVVAGVYCRGMFLPAVLSPDSSDCSSDADMGGSGVRLAFPGMYYILGQRRTAIVYRDCGAVFVQNLSGNETPPNLYITGFQ